MERPQQDENPVKEHHTTKGRSHTLQMGRAFDPSADFFSDPFDRHCPVANHRDRLHPHATDPARVRHTIVIHDTPLDIPNLRIQSPGKEHQFLTRIAST